VFIEYRTDANPYLRERRVKPREDKSRRRRSGGRQRGKG
jgi:hypothetical protein